MDRKICDGVYSVNSQFLRLIVTRKTAKPIKTNWYKHRFFL